MANKHAIRAVNAVAHCEPFICHQLAKRPFRETPFALLLETSHGQIAFFHRRTENKILKFNYFHYYDEYWKTIDFKGSQICKMYKNWCDRVWNSYGTIHFVLCRIQKWLRSWTRSLIRRTTLSCFLFGWVVVIELTKKLTQFTLAPVKNKAN